MADTTLTLGDFQFGYMEVPGEIEFGGSQRLNVHELIGGTRVIDAMGRSDKPLAWSGMMLGAGSLDRVLFLDGLRISGKPQLLTWGAFRYTVIVREFSATYQRAYKIPYRITCEVVQDLTTPVTAPGAAPIDQAIADDLNASDLLAASIGDSQLSGLMATLDGAISAVSGFAQAAQSTINSVLGPLAAVQSRVAILIASTGNTIANVSTFGGVLPGNPLSTSVAQLTNQVAAVTQCGQLYNLRNVLGRMSSNLGGINAPQNTVATAGGNLFQIAEVQYGDAMAWTGIAKANGLTDPFVQGLAVLSIPPLPDQQSGILAA